jgi:hypothetical protein
VFASTYFFALSCGVLALDARASYSSTSMGGAASGPMWMSERWHRVFAVKVYKWIILAISISWDFWLRWLVHEA